MGAAEWTRRDAAVVWHGFTQMASFPGDAPLIVERAEGRELIDVDGRRYLDAISSLWLTTLGHRVSELDAALVGQLGRVAHEKGFLVPAIRPPTVPRGTSRLRVTISAAHTQRHVAALVDALPEIRRV